MKWISSISLLISALVLVTEAAASPYIFHNGLAARNPRFPCDNYLNTVNAAAHPGFSVIWRSSFGAESDCMKRFLAANQHRDHLFLVYLENGNGRHDRSLEPTDFFPQFSCGQWNQILASRNQVALQAYADLVSEVTSFIAEYAGARTQVVIVPSLEDCFDSAAWGVLAPFLKERTPYLFVRNPSTGSGETFPAWFKERHGKKAKCDGLNQIANLDGDILSKRDTEKWLRSRSNCWALGTYDPKCQGRGEGRPRGSRFNRNFKCNPSWASVFGKF